MYTDSFTDYLKNDKKPRQIPLRHTGEILTASENIWRSAAAVILPLR